MFVNNCRLPTWLNGIVALTFNIDRIPSRGSDGDVLTAGRAGHVAVLCRYAVLTRGGVHDATRLPYPLAAHHYAGFVKWSSTDFVNDYKRRFYRRRQASLGAQQWPCCGYCESRHMLVNEYNKSFHIWSATARKV
eukprot:1195692-Prorocentrum_minimum.AAC.2